MQEEQEPSVTDILSSIRQILSNKLEGKEDSDMVRTEPAAFDVPDDSVTDDSDFSNDTITQDSNEPVAQVFDEEVLFLTPQMQIQPIEPDEQPVVAVSEKGVDTVDAPMTPEAMESNIQPMIQEWLDRHLPQMVERIVSEEVRRIFNKR